MRKLLFGNEWQNGNVEIYSHNFYYPFFALKSSNNSYFWNTFVTSAVKYKYLQWEGACALSA